MLNRQSGFQVRLSFVLEIKSNSRFKGTVKHTLCGNLRIQLVGAWKRHVIYNIGKWTVDWVKDQLALRLPANWPTMPQWKRGKLGWSVYTYVTVGLSDGVDFAKRTKQAAAAKKRKRD